MQKLWPYRWQIGLLPFFVASIWIALWLDVANNKTEFVVISVLYALADVLVVNHFTAESPRTRSFSLMGATVLFEGIFFFTYFAYGEAQYLLARPLFWVVGWKTFSRELAPRLYPHGLDERALVTYMFIASSVAYWWYAQGYGIPTAINLVQFFGVALFGLSLGVRGEEKGWRERLWIAVGTIGLVMFTTTCLADVFYKYLAFGEIIATPLVAFFAALPVAIVMARDLIVKRAD